MNKKLLRGLLVAFLVVDAVLIAVAVRHVGSGPSDDTTAIKTPVADPQPTDAATDDAGQVPYKFTPAEAIALSAANDGTIVYGLRGQCNGQQAQVLVSTNNGTDFAPAPTGLATMLAAKADGADSITIVGEDPSCQVRQISSTDGGLKWTLDDTIDLWYPAPRDTESVVSPDRTSKPGDGCVVTSLSQVTKSTARVSCADGTLRGTGDGGDTWVRLGSLENVRVATFLSPSAGFALARYSGCGANAFTTSDGGTTWAPGGCIAGDPAQAIAATSNGLTAVVATEPYVSTDDGKTWKQP